jgi:DUF438 domain-containing protein
MPIIYDQNDEGCEFALLITKYSKLFAAIRELHEEQQKLAAKVQTDIDKSIRELRADQQHSYALMEAKTVEIYTLSNRLAETIKAYNKEIDTITKSRIEKETGKAKSVLTKLVRPLAKEVFSEHVKGDLVTELQSMAKESSRLTSVKLNVIGLISLTNLIVLVLIVFRVI